ncbi:MAG: hypothetical protein WC485_06165 [Opitutaceae bacterium]
MHSRRLTFIPAALTILLVGCSTTATPSKPATAVLQPAAAASGNGAESKLQKGMPAEAVKRLMGAPDQITPIQSPTGKAEVWIYHRTTRGPEKQVPFGAQISPMMVQDPNGDSHLQQVEVGTLYKMQIQIIDETIQLLMFDGKYLEHKRVVATRFEYQ